MTTQIHRIADRPATFPCWLYSTRHDFWSKFDDWGPLAGPEDHGWTHWHPDQPSVPTATPPTEQATAGERGPEMVSTEQLHMELPIDKSALLLLGFYQRKSDRYGYPDYVFELGIEDKSEREQAALIVEKGNGSDDSCWTVRFFAWRGELSGGHTLTLKHGARKIGEIIKLIQVLHFDATPRHAPAPAVAQPPSPGSSDSVHAGTPVFHPPAVSGEDSRHNLPAVTQGETPRTDAEAVDLSYHGKEKDWEQLHVPVPFARQLERELNEAKAEAEHFAIQLSNRHSEANDLRQSVAQLTSERDEARDFKEQLYIRLRERRRVFFGDAEGLYVPESLLTAAESELAELRLDRERLDWLESELLREMPYVAHGPVSLFRRNEPITRAAIDAARTQQENRE